MKKSIVVLASHFQKDMVLECTVSAVLIVGCAVIGFLSRTMMLDLQAILILG